MVIEFNHLKLINFQSLKLNFLAQNNIKDISYYKNIPIFVLQVLKSRPLIIFPVKKDFSPSFNLCILKDLLCEFTKTHTLLIPF